MRTVHTLGLLTVLATGAATAGHAQTYGAQAYGAQTYGAQQAYSAQTYAAQSYSAQSYSAYGAQAYGTPAYAAQAYAAQPYAAQAYAPPAYYPVYPQGYPQGACGTCAAQAAPPPVQWTPPPVAPAQCYAKNLIPAVTESYAEQVLVSPARTDTVIQPGETHVDRRTVLKREASVDLVEIPPTAPSPTWWW